MAPRNSKVITPSTAPVIRVIAEYSLHRLPKDETEEDLMNILNAYIESKGKNTEARSYLEQSDFIQDIAKRLQKPEESCTIENLDTIFSYMQANNLEPILLEQIFLLDNNPNNIMNFIDMYLPSQLSSYTDWKILFDKLETWEHIDSKAWPLYDGYIRSIQASVLITAKTRSLAVSITGGYSKLIYDEANRAYVSNDKFTIENQSSLFVWHIHDLEYIRNILTDMAEATKMDIFSLFMIDPNDLQEWENQN